MQEPLPEVRSTGGGEGFSRDKKLSRFANLHCLSFNSVERSCCLLDVQSWSLGEKWGRRGKLGQAWWCRFGIQTQVEPWDQWGNDKKEQYREPWKGPREHLRSAWWRSGRSLWERDMYCRPEEAGAMCSGSCWGWWAQVGVQGRPSELSADVVGFGLLTAFFFFFNLFGCSRS